LTDCDGSDQTILQATSCTVPALSLHLAPFELPWASSVWAKIVATNAYGSTEQSLAGNNGIIYAVPDAPVNLQENYDDRTGTTLGLTWEDGADPGGKPVVDYKVTVTSSDGLYSVVTEYLTSQNYVAIGLTKGVIYYFSVQSRNGHGYSLISE
jgi:hypothetical protein